MSKKQSKCAGCKFGVCVRQTVSEQFLKPPVKKREDWMGDDEDNLIPDPDGEPSIQEIQQQVTVSFCYYRPNGEPTDEPVASFHVVDECSAFSPK